jgi:polyisoprenoid-binding protein YceI
LARIFKTAPLLVVLALAGCGEDPAASVPKADVAAPKPIAAVETKPATEAASPAEPKAKEAAADPGAALLAIEPATSKIAFIGSKKVGGAHNGGFKAFHGTAELVPGKPELKAIVVDIDTPSIEADDPKLTEHLKNKDFFEVEKYPTAKFVTTEIKPGGDKGATHTLVGNLTLHGVTKSITIPAVLKVDADSLVLTSEFALNKDDFGMTFSGPGGVIRPEVVIKLDVKAAKKG